MNQIPKVIHYIWFGHGQKPELLQKCIESWKKYLPGWEIHEWNESNFDISACNYAMEAYEAKKYAFASDYARFVVLYQNGGVYLDTDVEMLKPFPENLLSLEGFSGMESNNKIAPGLIFAVQPRNPIVKKIIDVYEGIHFHDTSSLKTIVDYTTELFEQYGFHQENSVQDVAGFRIFPAEYFCGYDLDIKEYAITPNTISVHHYAHTWGNPKSKRAKKIKMAIKRIVGVKNYRKLLMIKRKLFGVSK